MWAGPSEPILSAESAVLLPPRPRASHLAGPSESHTAEVIPKCLLGTRGISRGSLSGTAIPSHMAIESLPLLRSLGKICRELLENYQAQALCCASGMYQPISTADTSTESTQGGQEALASVLRGQRGQRLGQLLWAGGPQVLTLKGSAGL